MELEIVPAYDRKEDIAQLFTEYTNMLVKMNPTFGKYLDKQNYNKELANLEEKYGAPAGRLYVAYVDGVPAGCVGLRRLNDENCELKRMYVRPEYRDRHLGSALMHKVIGDAGEIGYAHMMLDTLPVLERAIEMYRRYGFYEIESYNGSPMDGLLYLKLDLYYVM